MYYTSFRFPRPVESIERELWMEMGSLTAYLMPSLLLRRVSFLRLRSWKPAWMSLMNLLI